MDQPTIRFAVIGLNHGHYKDQTNAMLRAGAELVWVFAKEPELLQKFHKEFPQAGVARSEKEILEDASIQLVVCSSILNERATLGIEVMRAGKDFMSDKPGATSLEQLAQVRRVQAQTRRIYSIMYGERFSNAATVRAGHLVKAGAIGDVIQTVGLGPHRAKLQERPPWFFQKARYGGILCDIAAHQFDQFLFFTGSTRADVIAAQVGNVHHPQHPELEDFGDAMLRGNGGTGYLRVDWLTPDSLTTWGDARLTILGTEGYIEVRKNVDLAGRDGGNHLFLADRKSIRYINCDEEPLPYGRQLIHDILHRTETAMTQSHCFLAMELALKAQKQAQRITQTFSQQ